MTEAVRGAAKGPFFHRLWAGARRLKGSGECLLP